MGKAVEGIRVVMTMTIPALRFFMPAGLTPGLKWGKWLLLAHTWEVAEAGLEAKVGSCIAQAPPPLMALAMRAPHGCSTLQWLPQVHLGRADGQEGNQLRTHEKPLH